ncbi:MAG: shikimate dehydrogenase [Pyrinomonadaceae bacterium]|nr:shikimate dehydrogenase [Pyrinomonadaceae bacterium]
MKKGKICVSICAETAGELLERIKYAEDLADVVEIRFDCLRKSEFDIFFRQFSKSSFTKKVLATFRAHEQGGTNCLTFKERSDFWRHSHIFESTDWADVEEDISIKELRELWGADLFEKFIISSHFFEGVPKNLIEIYDKLSGSDAEVIKIAAQTNEITGTIPIWKLLERAKSENKEIIPIAMGESGKWTRILGLAHGAFLTYAALDSGKETAPGQVSAKDLIEVYRAKDLDENTDIYGIIGGNTSYSISPYVHNSAFKFHKLNSVFIQLQVQNLDEFMRRMVLEKSREIELNFKGFAVTIPHKQSIIKYLDEIDETAEKIGAVNTVKIENGKLYGYNTDAQGFVEPLKNSFGDLSNAKVAVFGNGGAARACIYALKNENAEVTIFARNIEKAETLAEEFKVQSSKFKVQNENYNEFDILVNTTPLGTKGDFEDQTIVFAEQIETVKLVYDLVYSPFQTKLMSEADKVHVPKIGGLAMLIAQAMQQQKIWTGKDAPMKEMSRAALERLN